MIPQSGSVRKRTVINIAGIPDFDYAWNTFRALFVPRFASRRRRRERDRVMTRCCRYGPHRRCRSPTPRSSRSNTPPCCTAASAARRSSRVISDRDVRLDARLINTDSQFNRRLCEISIPTLIFQFTSDYTIILVKWWYLKCILSYDSL